MATEYDNQGGLNNPDVNAASQSQDIRNTLQAEIDRQNAYTRSRQFRARNAAAWLTPYSNLAQALATSDASRDRQYQDLFKMRQELGQAELLKSLRPQALQSFANYDPATRASLEAQYNMNPGQATKAGSGLGVDRNLATQADEFKRQQMELEADLRNKAPTEDQKNLAAAGIEPGSPEYRAKMLGDSDMATWKQKQDYANTLAEGKANRQSALDLNRELTVAQVKLEEKESQKLAEKRSTEGAGALQALNTVNSLYDILKNPKFESSWVDRIPGSGIGRQIFDPETSELQDKYRGDAAKLVLPSAKQLGSNPSNRDAQIIQSTLGTVGERKGALGAKLYSAEIQWKVAQAKTQFKGSEAEWSAPGGPGEKAWSDAIEETNPKYEGLRTKGNTDTSSKSSSHPDDINNLLGKYK